MHAGDALMRVFGMKRVQMKDDEYLDFIREHPCLVCGADGPSLAHHEPPKGHGGANASDYETVPLCPHDHRVRHGQEQDKRYTARDIIDIIYSRRGMVRYLVEWIGRP